jgi:cardiolipin synthase
MMTLANIVTVLRFLGIAPLLYLFFYGPIELFYVLLVLILLGDLADGALARAYGQVTPLGKMLDPLTDKALFLSLFVALALRGDLPWTTFFLFLAPHAALLLGALMLRLWCGRWIIIEARLFGKASSALIALGILSVFFWREIASLLLYLGIGLSYIALFDYGWAVRKQLGV